MTLEQLRIFLAVAEVQHVTRAARALHLTQSAVSAAIATLEGQHGVQLFDRVGRGIVLTEAGERFMSAARAVLDQAELAKLTLDDLARNTRGRLRIAASQSVASYWLPARLVALHDRHPGIEISLRVVNTEQAAQAVLEGSADLGFVEGPLPPSDLRRQTVARDELVLIFAAGHPDADRPSFTAEDYRRFRWVLREPGSGTRAEVEAHLTQMDLTVDDLDTVLDLPSNEAVLAAVTAGGTVAMLSDRAVGPAPEARGLVLRPVTWTRRPERTFAVLSHPQRHRTRAAQALLDLMAGAEPAAPSDRGSG